MTTTPAPKKKAQPKGLTKMARDTHNYDGYAVRRAVNLHAFRKYVGAGPSLVGKGPASFRFKKALSIATEQLDNLNSILDNPRSWRTEDGKKQLTKKSALEITKLGFKIDFPSK